VVGGRYEFAEDVFDWLVDAFGFAEKEAFFGFFGGVSSPEGSCVLRFRVGFRTPFGTPFAGRFGVEVAEMDTLTAPGVSGADEEVLFAHVGSLSAVTAEVGCGKGEFKLILRLNAH
jgi:hypothetical protein